jgi:hypothetical protein
VLYDQLKDVEYPHYDFVYESRDNTVNEVTKLISETKIEGYLNFFQFLVDDMLFFREVNIPEILKILETYRDKVYTAHLKLHPGINYSHTTDKMIARMPTFHPLEGRTNYLIYDRTESELDWNYPFDFCGSIYLLDRVTKVVESIEEREKIRKPNMFEFIGNKAIKTKNLANQNKFCLCLNIPVMTVITVNKVQDVYDTPIYSTFTESDCLEFMNQCMRDRKALAIDNYYSR